MHQSKMPHTPGPWGFTYDGSSDWSIGPADDPQARRIASVWDRDDARAEANVRLIAAAPELLAACKALSDALASRLGEFEMEPAVLYEAYALIRKAEGQ